jgi:hypothetical protein
VAYSSWRSTSKSSSSSIVPFQSMFVMHDPLQP